MAVIFAFTLSGIALADEASGIPPLEQQAPLPAGTEITPQNWQQYKDYMTVGQQGLFSGQYFWKIQPDQKMVVGPTQEFHLPKQYMTDTEKYSGQVSLKVLPEGAGLIENYEAGIPFPHPSGPQAGVEILWNDWYRYVPYWAGAEPGNGTYIDLIDRYHNLSAQSLSIAFARLGHLSDPQRPIYPLKPFDYGEYVEVIAPEQAKYSVSLILFYLDPLKVQETWSFVPSLRRALRLSAASRCSPSLGSDLDLEDQRFGYNGQSSTFDVKVVGHKKILGMLNLDVSQIPNYGDTKGATAWGIPSMVWVPPSAGKWELREVYIIELQKVPSQRPGYCYGLRRMYVDAQGFFTHAYEFYDMNMKVWKFAQENYGHIPLPNSGGDYYVAAANGAVQLFWDIQNDHATAVMNPNPRTNDEIPAQYRNVQRYMSPAGLLDVMK